MGSIKDAIDRVWRDFATDGVAASGVQEPRKEDIRAVGPVLETAISNAALGAVVDVAYATKDELDADLAHDAAAVGLVYADAADANNDLYVKTGASGAGAWTLTTILHDTIDSRAADVEGQLLAAAVVVAGATPGASDFSAPAAAGSTNFRVPNYVFAKGGYLDDVDVHMDVGGEPTFYSYSRDGDTFTPYESQKVALTAGYNAAVALNLRIPEGGYVGCYNIGIALGSGSQWAGGIYVGSTSTFTDSSAATTGSPNLVRFNCSEYRGLTPEEAADRLTRGAGLATPIAPAATRPPQHRSELLEPVHFYLGMHGQSPMVGTSAAVTTRQEFGALSFELNLSVVEPARAPDCGANEFPGFGAAAYVRRRVMDEGGPSNIAADGPVITGRSGSGGTALADLDKGSSYYTAAIDQLTAANTYASGAAFAHGGQMLYQGHQDQVAGTAKATYAGLLVTLAQDYDTDARAAVAGADLRRTYVVQVCSGLDYGLSQEAAWDITQAQFESCRDEPLLSLIGPDYMVDYADDRHTTAAHARVIGAYAARAAMTGRKFEPLMAVDSYVTATAIVLVYNREDLVLDTSTVYPQTQYGFRAYDEVAAEVAITSVTVNEATVTLELGVDPTGYSWDYGNLLAQGMAPYGGGAGNLRDSAGDTDVFEGWPLHNWAVLQEGTL